MFEHRLLDLPPIESETTEEGRYYATPGGVFPSVTTVLSRHKGTSELDEWRARVGEERARSVSTRAKLRGTAVHDIAERYLLNDPDWAAGRMPVHLDSFLSIKKILDERVGAVFAVEAPLWCSRLRTAGRTDVVAEWDGTPAIIDFKTSTRVKKQSEIFSYFVQEACYSAMVRARTSLLIPRIVTLMMVDHDQPLVFIRDAEEFAPAVEKIFVLDRQGVRDGGRDDAGSSEGLERRGRALGVEESHEVVLQATPRS